MFPAAEPHTACVCSVVMFACQSLVLSTWVVDDQTGLVVIDDYVHR